MSKKKKRSHKYNYSSADLINYIWNKRIHLAVITIAAFILSTIASFLITPMYRSSVVLFPSTGTSISQILSSDNYSGRYDIYGIGEEEQAEKLLQVLNSNQIRDRIIIKYNLVEHYNFKPGEKFLKTKLTNQYQSNVKFKRTPFRSVVIEVMDAAPEMSADIANDIADLADTVFHRIVRQRALEAYNLVEKEYEDVSASVALLEDSLGFYSKQGINDYETQAERYHEAYGKAVLEDNMNAARIIEGKLKLLSNFGTQYLSLRTKLTLETTRLSQLMRRYSEAKLESEQKIPYKFVVDAAEIPDKKAYPRKSLIILVSTISAFLFGLVSLFISDAIRRKHYYR